MQAKKLRIIAWTHVREIVQTGTAAYDNLGNQCCVDIIFGTNDSRGKGTTGGSLLVDTPIKVKVILSKFSPKATSFSQIRIKSENWDYQATYAAKGYFIFKNIPIVRNQEIEVAIPVKKTENTSAAATVNPGTATVKTDINIAKTKGIMSLKDTYNAHNTRTRITAAERTTFQLNNIKNSTFDIKWANSKLSKGKVIYEGEYGKLQTVMYIEPDHGSDEFLLSYDKSGNLSDCIPIGSIRVYSGDRGEAIIEGDLIVTCINAGEPGEERTSSYTSYKITPELNFQKLKQWAGTN